MTVFDTRPINCSHRLRDEERTAPRTCSNCGLGPCPFDRVIISHEFEKEVPSKFKKFTNTDSAEVYINVDMITYMYPYKDTTEIGVIGRTHPISVRGYVEDVLRKLEE